MENETTRSMIFWFFLALFLASFFLMARLIWPFISILVMAAVVSGMFSPLHQLFCRLPWLKPAPASVLTCLVIFFLLFIPIVMLVGLLSGEAFDLVQWARNADLTGQIRGLLADSQLLEKVNEGLVRFNFQVTGEQINRGITELGKVVGLFIYRQSTAIASNLFKFLVNFFFMLLITYFLLIDGRRLAKFIVDLSPLPEDQDEKLIGKFKDMAGAILVGNGLCALIQGLLGGVVFWFFGLRSPILWGVIMGLLAFMPIVGIGAVFLPAAGYLVFTGRVGAGIFFILFYIVLSGGVEYLLKPKVVGDRVQMHTLLVFLASVGGLHWFGILGIIYGPLVATAFLTLTDIYHASYQELVEPARRPIAPTS
ncbi:MAG: AI-2E family transporter [Desulfobacterales bacterium]|jgi:predicted PurR-regulated permease PerM